MKKSNKNKEETLNDKLQDIIGDMEGLLSLIGEINSTKIENLDLKDLSSKVNKFENIICHARKLSCAARSGPVPTAHHLKLL